MILKRIFKSENKKKEEDELLRFSCNKGDIDKVEELISVGAEINGKDSNGKTPLINAIIGNNIEIMRLLMKSGASVTSVDEYGKTPLIHAIINNNIEAMRILLNNINVKINKAYGLGKKPIDYAIEQNNIETIYLLLERNVELEFVRDVILLRYASEIGHFETVKILLENYNTTIETKDNKERTPLFLASKNGNLEIVDYLLEKGADIEARDKEDRTCLMNASKEGRLNIVEFLLEKGANIEEKDKRGNTPLIHASRESHLNIIKLLLEKGANPKTVNKAGYNILDIAVNESPNKELVLFLLDNVFSLDFENEELIEKLTKLIFNSPVKTLNDALLHYQKLFTVLMNHIVERDYITNESMDVINFFIKYGYTKNISYENYYYMLANIIPEKISSSPEYTEYRVEIIKLFIENDVIIDKENLIQDLIAITIKCQNLKLLKYLIEKGAQVDIEDNKGNLPIFVASRQEDVNIIKYLLEKGAAVDVKDKYGRTSVHYAANSNNEKVLEFFILEKNLEVNSKDYKNKTPLHYASSSVVSEVLIKNGANMEAKDDEGNTPLDIAIECNLLCKTKYLLENGAHIDFENEERISSLIKLIFDKEIKNIYEAIIENDLEIVKFFINNGINTNLTYNNFSLTDICSFLGHKNILDYLLTYDNNSLFKNVVDRIIIGGFENVTLFINIDNCSKKPLYYELAYTLESDKYIDWENKTNEIQKILGLKNIELFEKDGLYFVKVFNNTNESKLICSLLIDSKKPDFIDFIEQNYTSYFLFKNIPGVGIDAWKNQKLYIEDILGLPVDIEVYDNLHSLWGKFGFEQLILIKESNISIMPDHFEIGGRYLKMNIEDGFKQYYFVDVLDYELWLDKKEEITKFLDFNFEIKKINDGVILKESVENSLPKLLELQDSHKNYPQLYCVKTDGKNKAYYYTFLPEISLKNWKEQAKKKNFRTLFNQPDKVYKLDVYDKTNKELYDEDFYKGQLIVLNEYEEIPLKDSLGELSEKILVKDKVFWGYGSGSKLYYTSIDDLSHFMIIGATGSGKSNFMNGIILSLMNSIEIIQKMFLIDLKSGIEFNRYKDLNSDKIEVFTKGTKPSNLLSALYEIEAEMYLREEYMLNNSITKITKDPIFVIIDEFAQIDLMNSSTPDERKSKDEIFNVLLRIGTRSRSANIKLFIQTQDPRSVSEDLKKHLMSRALLKTGKESDKDLTLQNPDILHELGIVHTKFDKGRYVFEDYNDGDTKLNELQFPFLDPKKELHLLFKDNAKIHSENIKNKYKKYIEFVYNEYKYLCNTKLLSSFNKTEKIEKKSFEQQSNTKNELDPIMDEFDFDSLLNNSEEKEDLFEDELLEINKTYLESKKLLEELKQNEGSDDGTNI